MASRKAYQRLEEGDEWDGHLNPRAPIHKETGQEGTEKDDDVMCIEMDLVNSGGNVVEVRERGNEIEQEAMMRASPRTPTKQRRASHEHRTDNATPETEGNNKRFMHREEQHTEERTAKGKHRKSRMDDLGEPRPST